MFFRSFRTKEVSASFILPSSLLPIAICDSEEKIVKANDSLCQLLGYSYQELLDKNISEITSLSSEEENFLLCALKKDIVIEYDTVVHFKTKSGQIIKALINVVKTCDEVGNYLERVILLQRVYKEEQSTEFIASTTFKIGTEHYDEYLEDLTKNLAKSLKSDLTLIASFSENRNLSKVRLLLYDNKFYKKFVFKNEGTPFETELNDDVIIYKDGVAEKYPKFYFLEKYGFRSLLLIPLFDLNKKCIGYICFLGKVPIVDKHKVSDLVFSFPEKIGIELERSNQLQALVENERRYKLVFDHSTDGIIISDYKLSKVIDYNQKILSLFRMKKEDLENMTNSLDFSPEFQPDGRPSKEVYQEMYSKAFSSGKLETYKWRFQRLDKSEFDAEVILAPYDHALDLSRWMVIVRDITERKTLEKRAEELKELKIQELLNLTEKEELQIELDYRNRELSSNFLLDCQKSNQLSAIRESLQKMISQVEPAIRKEINRLIRGIDRNIDLDADWKKFQLHFEEVHPDFFTKLNKQFPDLSAKQLRHCAYIKLGLSSKETAQLLNLAPKSIEMARYRLKKKMNFGTGDRFYEFILSL